jgi:hypothetical protein
MARAKNKKRKKHKPPISSNKDQRNDEPCGAANTSRNGNFDPVAGPGCHIARRHPKEVASSISSWVIEWEDVNPEDYEEDENEIPDLAIDEGELILCNFRDYSIVAYITVFDAPLRGRNGHALEQGSTADDQGTARPCTTLIVQCPPRVFAHLCYIDDERIQANPELLDLDSDVQEWSQHPCPNDTHSRTIRFPLQGDGPYKCTQGEGGHLTHFFSGNLHAVDFQCPVGTPVLAAGDGVVVEVEDSHRLTGIATSNLFQWNSILIQLLDGSVESTDNLADDGPLFVEYVHIQSSLVRKGDRVEAGQVVGTTGSVGFSPEPHLHLAAYRSSDPAAATVRVFFESSRNRKETFLPRAGCFYNSEGQVALNQGD